MFTDVDLQLNLGFKSENIVFTDVGLHLNLDSRNYCVHRCWFSLNSGFMKILCTPIFPLFLKLLNMDSIFLCSFVFLGRVLIGDSWESKISRQERFDTFCKRPCCEIQHWCFYPHMLGTDHKKDKDTKGATAQKTTSNKYTENKTVNKAIFAPPPMFLFSYSRHHFFFLRWQKCKISDRKM